MQDGPQSALERLISEGQGLLERYNESIAALKNSSSDLSDTIWSELAGVVAGDIFESGRIGSQARKITKASMKGSRHTRLQEINNQFNERANSWVSKAGAILNKISTKSSKTPNSHKLVSKLSKVERFVKPDTKLRNGISVLKELILQGVVSNEDLTKPKAKGLIAKPGEQFVAFNRILEIASRAVGTLIIIDPYPSNETLLVLEKSPRKLPAKLLTNLPQKSKNRNEFEVLARKLKKDRSEIDIRYAPANTLHDRFMITKSEAWHIGHSIKDIGNKLSAITPMGFEEKEQLVEEFDTLWNQAIVV